MQLLSISFQTKLLEFTQALVRIKSYSGQEEEAIKIVEKKMIALGYDEVIMDQMGNVLGRIGNGAKFILFDSHLDTVEVNDESEWDVPLFSGKIIDGRLHGRGSVDMKSSVAASVYAEAIAKQQGFTKNKTVYVPATVFEEDCDSENLKHLFKKRNLRPDCVVICEPSNNIINLGHKGKAQIAIKTHGVSAHGSAPEKGKNAIYEMAEIIQRVEKKNLELMKQGDVRGTLVMSKISSVSASLNAVPSECEAYLDRRTIPGETEADIKREMDELIEGKNASWKVGTLHCKSWTGLDIHYEPFHAAWKIDEQHPLTQACIAAYSESFGLPPTRFDFWDFSTNAVSPISLGIPTIGFGPGDYKMAHMRNESIEVKQILEACGFYETLVKMPFRLSSKVINS
jgi:putative selenium metabolism hydrolase